MNNSAFRDADGEAANLGKKRKKLARWWRPLVDTFVAGALAFVTLLSGDRLGLIGVENLYPWGIMLIVSMFFVVVPVAPLLIMMPLDVYWDRKMRKAFQRRRLAMETIDQKPKGQSGLRGRSLK